MSAQSNVARPYAQALFELAQDQDNLSGWHDQLQLLALVTSDPSMANLTNDPHVSSEQLASLIIDVCGDNLHSQGQNLVRLLVKNGRVSDMADIADAYAARKADAEKVVAAEMITASEMNEAQQKKFSEALQAKLGRTVDLEFEVDEELIGGAVIRAGDWVVDGSVKAQLEQLVGAIGS
jgi:F-type H+-transporting ATPase subunit delta